MEETYSGGDDSEEDGPKIKRQKRDESPTDDWHVLPYDHEFENEVTEEEAGTKVASTNGRVLAQISEYERTLIVLVLNSIARIIKHSDDSFLHELLEELELHDDYFNKDYLEPVLDEIASGILRRFCLNTADRPIASHVQNKASWIAEPKYIDEFFSAENACDKIQLLILNIVSSLKTVAFVLTVKHNNKAGRQYDTYTRSTSIFVTGLNANHTFDKRSLSSFCHVFYLMPLYVAMPDKEIYLSDPKYRENKVFVGQVSSISQQLTTAWNLILKLIDEPLNFISEVKASLLGNFKVSNEDGSEQIFKSSTVSEIKPESVHVTTIDKAPKFVLLFESKGPALEIAQSLFNKHRRAMIIITGGNASIGLRTFLYRLSQLDSDLKFYIVTDLNISGYLIFDTLQHGNFGGRGHSRSEFENFKLGSKLRRIAITHVQIEQTEEEHLMNATESDVKRANRIKLQTISLTEQRSGSDNDDSILEELQDLADNPRSIQFEQTESYGINLLKRYFNC